MQAKSCDIFVFKIGYDDTNGIFFKQITKYYSNVLNYLS